MSIVENPWSLWLDDQLTDINTPNRWLPKDGNGPWLGAPNVEIAKKLVETLGPPCFMDLDHDLGENDLGEIEESIHFLKWLYENYENSCPKYQVHSENPIGRENIHSFMRCWEKILGADSES